MEERLPLPPFPHIYLLGGRGRASPPPSRPGPAPPTPPPLPGVLPHPIPSWGGDTPPAPRALPGVSPPRAKLLISFPRSSGRNGQYPGGGGAGSGPGPGHKIIFYVPISQRLSFPRAYPCPNPRCKLCVASIREGLNAHCTVDAMCAVFLVEDFRPKMCAACYCGTLERVKIYRVVLGEFNLSSPNFLLRQLDRIKVSSSLVFIPRTAKLCALWQGLVAADDT